MYSQIDTLILKVITEYRIKYIKPYYTKDDNSVYRACNKKAEMILTSIAHILDQEGLGADIPSSFCVVDCFPTEDIIWKMLNKGELLSDEMVSNIRSEFRSNSYSDLSSYECYWDIDDMEVFVGMDFRGRTKYKDKYCYKNLNAAFQELAKDLLSACYYKDDYIVGRASDLAKDLVSEYNKKLENTLAGRVAYIEKKIHDIYDTAEKEIPLMKKYPKRVRRITYRDKEKKLYVDGCVIEDNEAFIAETEDGSKQFFYDGNIIKKRYISDGIIRSEEILKDEQPQYALIIGYGCLITFVSEWDLISYDCNSEKYKEIENELCKISVYKKWIFYSTLDNVVRRFDRYAAGSICCYKVDGSEKKTLLRTSYGNGIIFLKSIDNEKLNYETVGSNSISGTISIRDILAESDDEANSGSKASD